MRAPSLLAALVVLPALAGEPAPLPATLGETGFESSCKVAFTPRHPLWTDGLAKRRWICLPPGTSVDRRDPDAWDFPPGTRLWKEFARGERALETRFIERLSDGSWRYASYVWNAQGTEATLAPVRGMTVEGHRVPSRLDCLACHEGAAVPVLGYSAVQLSPLPLRGASPVESEALGYLHGNCGHCHNDAAAVAGVDLVLQQKASRPAEGRRKVLASLVGRTGRWHAAPRVAAGDPGSSAIVQRMKSTDSHVRMPPLGVSVPDARGIALVEAWILELANPQEK